MRAESIAITGFRNLQTQVVTFSPGVNLIYGKNAQGKTNLLEALWLMTGCKSFRGTPERDIIGFEQSKMQLLLTLQDSQRTQHISYQLQKPYNKKSRSLSLNGVPLQSTSGLFDAFRAVLFTPQDIELIKGAPEKRRDYFDMCICQRHSRLLGLVNYYKRVLNQRNALLKQIAQKSADRTLLSVLNQQLCHYGTQLCLERYRYFQEFAPIFKRLYSEITNGAEDISISYQSSVFSEENLEKGLDGAVLECRSLLEQKIESITEDEIRVGYTLAGPGRDDFAISLSGHSMREFGSQGQCKSSAIALKLAQAELFRKENQESPVILLDDVMGELDEYRQKVIYHILGEAQLLITTPSPQSVDLSGKTVKKFLVEQGKITEEA